MGLGDLFGSLAKNFLTGGTGASQQPAAIDRTGRDASPAAALESLNAAVSGQTSQGEPTTLARPALEQLSTAGKTATAPLVAPTTLATNNLAEATPAAAVKLEFSQAAVESLRPILSALTDLFKSILPGLNLQELATTAKQMLQALPQASSSPANTQATAATPA